MKSRETPTQPRSISAALLTPVGRGAVATLRIHGELDDACLAKLPFRAANGQSLAEQPIGRIVFGRWGRELFDPAPRTDSEAITHREDVVVCRRAFDSVEFHCHGGDAAARRILDDLQRSGGHVIDWSQQMTQAAGIFDADCADALSRATTWRTAEILYEQFSGTLLRALESLRQSFTDLKAIPVTMSHCRSQLDALLNWSSFGLHLSQPWLVVLTGRPNVGKSSLINALLGYERAIVFDQPGTTRDVVTAETAFDGWPVQLTDTAGMRATTETLEAAGIALALQRLQEADTRLVLVDLNEAPTAEDEDLIAHWSDAIVIGHKCDLADRWQSRLPSDAVRVSSVTGSGLEALQRRLVERLVPCTPAPGTPIPITQRQVRLLHDMRTALSTGDLMSCRLGIESILSCSE